MKFTRNAEFIPNPAQCINEIVEAWAEYAKIAQEEKTKRREIEAWEKTTLAEIAAKREILISYLDRAFDERQENFQNLFERADRAMESGNIKQLALLLNSITELAKTSPFKDLVNTSTVRAALNDPDHVWEF